MVNRVEKIKSTERRIDMVTHTAVMILCGLSCMIGLAVGYVIGYFIQKGENNINTKTNEKNFN